MRNLISQNVTRKHISCERGTNISSLVVVVVMVDLVCVYDCGPLSLFDQCRPVNTTCHKAIHSSKWKPYHQRPSTHPHSRPPLFVLGKGRCCVRDESPRSRTPVTHSVRVSSRLFIGRMKRPFSPFRWPSSLSVNVVIKRITSLPLPSWSSSSS